MAHGPFLKDHWYLLATSAEVKPGRHFRRDVLGEPVLVARGADGKAFALRDICPHRAVPLSAGRQLDTQGRVTVECPYHGWRFDAEGVCRLIPSLVEGETYDLAKVRVRRYPLHEANGMIFVHVGADPRRDEAPATPPPDFAGLPEKPKIVFARSVAAHMDDAATLLMDAAHEKKTLATRAFRALFGAGVTAETGFKPPGCSWQILESETARLVTLTCLTPEHEASTRATQLTYWSGAPLLDLLRPALIPVARAFGNVRGGSQA